MRDECYCATEEESGDKKLPPSEIPIYLGASKPLESEYRGMQGVAVHGFDGLGTRASEYFGEWEGFSVFEREVEGFEGQMEWEERQERNERSQHTTGDSLDAKTSGRTNTSTPHEGHSHKWSFPSLHAADHMVQQVNSHPDNHFTIICTGPLTNLALAVQRGLEVQKVRDVVHMGGAFEERGNVTPVAEANVFNDPHATHIVYHAGFRSLRVVPLNTTRGIVMTKNNFIPRLRKLNRIGKFLADVTDHYVDYLQRWEKDNIPMHDSTTLMLLLHPELFSPEEEVYCDVETEGRLTRGMTIPDRHKHFGQDNKPNVKLTLSCLDQRKYFNTYLEKLAWLGGGEVVKEEE
eukprot:CAMPEP_0117447344 /NCGR_PEP_ID=MMETSP0759-20121206/6826_1 /TAXON_ID=63605 /ORGANISM="Percolomonas cosmopolitus, Strain WS" /LENGTH=347 /DNA_ID=CAMNT_0005239675 /DNA_START=306 /DNA_END=1349 /DNA_ORIENTATION=-